MSGTEALAETPHSGGHEDPLRDPRRLDEIAALGLLSPDVGDVLRDVVENASTSLELPVALVSIVLDDAQHFAASTGLEGWMEESQGTPAEWSFCANAVRGGEPFVVQDAATHPLVKDNPLVQQDGFRCYAGIPLVTSGDHVIGTLCVLGDTERSFSARDLAELRRLAAVAVRRIEARRPEAD